MILAPSRAKKEKEMKKAFIALAVAAFMLGAAAAETNELETAEVEKTDAVKDEPVEDPSPVELPEEYFSNEPSEEPDMDI